MYTEESHLVSKGAVDAICSRKIRVKWHRFPERGACRNPLQTHASLSYTSFKYGTVLSRAAQTKGLMVFASDVTAVHGWPITLVEVMHASLCEHAILT